MFSNLEFSYSKSKDEVWSQLERLMEEHEEEPTTVERTMVPETTEADKVSRFNWRWMAAASVAILLSTGLFARFYTQTVAVEPGEFISHTLPDGSEVHLNAETSISYQPYWWRFGRGLDLQGEAYFVVAKGEKFTVNTTMGSAEVLGTEFNVYARGDDFNVFCEEGRVKVSSNILINNSKKEVILTQGHLATIKLNQLNNPVLLKQENGISNDVILAWRKGQFLFDSQPLSTVFEELERQYGISILSTNEQILKRPYSGNFSRNTELNELLDLLTLAMSLKYTEVQEGVYQIDVK